MITKEGMTARPLKQGMTNNSYVIAHKDMKYILRLPGEGTEKLIDRAREYEVYKTLDGLDLSDEVLFLDPENGIKITKYWDGSRVCDPGNMDDVCKCMRQLRRFHNMRLKVSHEFDLFGKILYYEGLMKSKSRYPGYWDTRNAVLSLKEYIEAQPRQRCLTHIDAVPDNFLFIPEGAEEAVKIIDWEYAGMQDPHVDLAMFAIYSFYNREQLDRMIDYYFEGVCEASVRLKIYCYAAAGGLLWSNWCEYKEKCGVQFGDYAVKQYEYARDYSYICRKAFRNGGKLSE